MSEQHSASWQMLEISASISMRMSSSVTPLIMLFSKKSMNFSLLSKMSVHYLPKREAPIIPKIYRHMSVFLAFVITIFISLSLIAPFIKLCSS